MTRNRAISSLCLAVIALALAAPAQAQAVRTFVSGHGTDSGTCGVGSPCRTFAYAITQTNPGGEIAVLDTAGYGVVTITKAVSIINQNGVEAGITTPMGTNYGVYVGAGATDAVTLRGLTITGSGIGSSGIAFISGGALIVENCTISGFFDDGLLLVPTGSSKFYVADTFVVGNGGGVFLGPNGTNATNVAAFERVAAVKNTAEGIFVEGQNASGGSVTANVSDSVITQNGDVGVTVASKNGGGGALATLLLLNSPAVNNRIGLNAATASMIISRSTVFGNTDFGFDVSTGGVIQSLHDNYIFDTTNFGSLTYSFTQQ
jgi:hypothetical protein